MDIKSTEQLAKFMAEKAHQISDGVKENISQNGVYKSRYAMFLDSDKYVFEDNYSQTLIYLIFGTKLNRISYGELIASDDFIKLFHEDIVNPALPSPIRNPIDEVVLLLKNTDLDELFKSYEKDGFMHFYEDFLAHYSPENRKGRGVWYTPDEVTDFIVRSVDDILQKDFNVDDGIAGDNVKILDPAAGTGAFPAKVVEIANKRIKEKGKDWNKYVDNILTNNLSAIEIMFTSAMIGRVNLKRLLNKFGYKGKKNIKYENKDSLNPNNEPTKKKRIKTNTKPKKDNLQGDLL